MTASARNVRPGDDAIARRQGTPVAREGAAGADLLDDSDVLVPADQRVTELSLVRSPCVLLRLAAIGVLVRAADAGEEDAHQHFSVPGLGTRELRHLELSGSPHHCGKGHSVSGFGSITSRTTATRSWYEAMKPRSVRLVAPNMSNSSSERPSGS